MKIRNRIYLLFVLMSCLMAYTSCKSKSSDEATPSTPPETPLFTEGQIVNSDFYVNDNLREQMIDTVINLGNKQIPALFYANQKHTLDGVNVAKGNSYLNVFRSLTRKELYDFIVIWGHINGLTVNPFDTATAAIEKRQQAFIMLQSFLMQNDVDLPMLVAMSQNANELKCIKQFYDAAGELSLSGVKLDGANTPGHILRSLEESGHQASDLTSAIRSAGMTERSFLLMAQQKGINLSATLQQAKSPQQVITVIALVFTGIKWFSTLTVAFITHGAPNPNLNDLYVSYLNNADSNVMNYIARKDTISPTYKVAYCTLATAEFYIETYYDAYHKTKAGQYINRSGMIVKSVRCSWGMHVDGDVDYPVGQYTGTETNPIAFADATVTVNYGDCCCNKRKATLKFNLSGDKGYTQSSWKSGK